jgi:signal transduction histidine kinase
MLPAFGPELARNTLEQPIVMIIADDPECARAIVARWQVERLLPGFTVVSSQLSVRTGRWDLAIVCGAEPPLPLLRDLHAGAAPVMYLAGDAAAAQAVRDQLPGITVLRAGDGWLDTVVLVGIEALRRAEALDRAHKAQQAAAQLQHQATLGRYMLEMRHNLNNALTSVLGNSELLLLEPGALPAAARDQIDTIRHMALRMQEIIHRFSSLEAEMRFAEKHPEREVARAGKGSAIAARAAD